ncbi:FKBP-type peptidyl-prolyl cis-trans isomerase [Candidatus Micrarchaeota archaeon]|nr:FKBP-type peptidyl-prolyl cis-trans isomerase [Candidatus Micrarchaeota archaeon]MBU2476333.1 FKBP-type peptidyl-prolyl cis-trans isomerase [Candidatus Micrarchaeota archaeon]
MKKVLILLIFGLILFGCTENTGKANEVNSQQKNNLTEEIKENTSGGDLMQTVEVGDTIKVEYIGKFPDSGEVFDQSTGRGPLEFTVGAGQMIKGFDSAVLGMKLNQEKTVILLPEDAYGTLDSGQEMQVPLSQIDGGESLEVGSILYASNGQAGTIIAINDGTATIKFVHPMAGKTLEFWIKVVEINKK